MLLAQIVGFSNLWCNERSDILVKERRSIVKDYGINDTAAVTALDGRISREDKLSCRGFLDDILTLGESFDEIKISTNKKWSEVWPKVGMDTIGLINCAVQCTGHCSDVLIWKHDIWIFPKWMYKPVESWNLIFLALSNLSCAKFWVWHNLSRKCARV